MEPNTNIDALHLIHHRHRAATAPTYVAGPYLHPDLEVKQARLEVMTAYVEHVAKLGVAAYSPVMYTNIIQQRGANSPQGWYHYDLSFMKMCSSMTLLLIPGYEESFGVRLETGVAVALNMPIAEVSWDELLSLIPPEIARLAERYNR